MGQEDRAVCSHAGGRQVQLYGVIHTVWRLYGDFRHVVNCVQPHPTDPLLATSGIDYDVKVCICT